VLLQPYKNRLMPRRELIGAVNRFAGALLAVCAAYPRLRFNAAMPGYMLECVDKRLLGPLAETVRRGAVECLCMGYTEPFLSFSPLWLTSENIARGVRVFSELTSEAPGGFVPPFSNWEPSYIDMLYGAGLKYAVVSNELLAEGGGRRNGAGYWITESTGNSMAVFPARSCDSRNAPQDLAEWVKGELPDGGAQDGAPRILILKYMYSLETSEPETGGDASAAAGGKGGRKRKTRRDGDGGADGDPQRSWLERTAAEIDKRILELQPMRFRDVVGDAEPLGLHYFPSSLVPPGDAPVTPYFMNYLHCYDQISVMQRKLMDAGDSVAALKDARLAARLKYKLFFAQDINRFLPHDGDSGFVFMPDRLWTYGRLIDIENELYGRRGVSGGVIRLSEFLRNGYKSVIMANRALKLYIDHKNGGQVYELDYLERSLNVCAAYNPAVRRSPEVVDPVESRLAFSDKIFIGQPTYGDYEKRTAADCGNFSCIPMEYAFKGSPGGVRILLSAAGGFTQEGRLNPLTMDKVFSLEKDSAVLSYSYKLGNPTPAPYAFTFAIEIPLSLPGVPARRAELKTDRLNFDISVDAPVAVNDVTEWEINDEEAGVRLEFVTQKKVNIWLFTQDAVEETVLTKKTASAKSSVSIVSKGAYGATLMITSQTEIEPNSTQSFTGRICFKKIRMRGGIEDAV